MTVLVATITPEDERAVEQFRNFLSWGAKPVGLAWPTPARHVPPAWWAYALGLTDWCPPRGEL